MATRLYFNESQSGAINIGAQVGSLWEQNISGAFTTKRARTTPDNNANASHNTSSLGSGSNPSDICFGQFLTDEMPSGVLIDGTIEGVICCREGNTSDNMYTQLAAYVVDSSGALVHTLLGGSTSGGSELNSPSANTRDMPRGGAKTLSSYTTVNATSRIVIEIGLRTESTRTTCQGLMYFGSGDTSDLPTGDGTSNNLLIRPWVQFSADIFTPPSGGGARAQASAFYGSYHQDPEHGAWKRRSRSGLWVRSWEEA